MLKYIRICTHSTGHTCHAYTRLTYKGISENTNKENIKNTNKNSQKLTKRYKTIIKKPQTSKYTY